MRMPKANQTFLENPEINLQRLSDSTVVERMLCALPPSTFLHRCRALFRKAGFFKYGGVRC
jgi:hypothetical protein